MGLDCQKQLICPSSPTTTAIDHEGWEKNRSAEISMGFPDKSPKRNEPQAKVLRSPMLQTPPTHAQIRLAYRDMASANAQQH